MTRQSEQLENVRKNLTKILKVENHKPAIERAIENADSWAELPTPRGDERGGSSSPQAIEERHEIMDVIRMAVDAQARLPWICKEVDRLLTEADGLVQRLTAVTDPKRYGLSVDPKCLSCARKEGKDASKIGDHFAPIYEKAKKWSLCEWCYRHAVVMADALCQAGDEVTPGDKRAWPPVRACELLHTQSARAAGVWMSKTEAKVA